MRSTQSGRKAISVAIRNAASASVESLEGRMHLTASADQILATSPAVFMANQGQFANPAIRYAYKGNGLNVGMTDSGMQHQFYNAAGVLQFNASLVNGRTVAPIGQNPTAATFSFLTDSPATSVSGVPTFGKVSYPGVYAGIDLQTYGLTNQLKYEFHVAPGADYRQIAVQYEGIEGLSISADGSLRVNLGEEWGTLVDDAPYIYQVINGQQVSVAGQFVLVDSDTYAFQITGTFDASKELVIDPYVAWSSFIGGNKADTATSVTTTNDNYVIVGGKTLSSGWIDESLFNGKRFNDSGLEDGYVMKYSPDGSLVWGVFVGGEYNDTVNGVAVDEGGDVYAVGTTNGGRWAFGPGTDMGVMVETYHGGTDSFVMKITSQGQYGWASFIGGTGNEAGLSIAASGQDVFIAGTTTSVSERVNVATLAPNQTSGRWTGYSPTLGLAFTVGFNIDNPGTLSSPAVHTLKRGYDQPVKGTWDLVYTYTLGDDVYEFPVSLPYNATAEQIQAALRAVVVKFPQPATEGGAADLANIVVTGGPFNTPTPTPITFTFNYTTEFNTLGPKANGKVGTLRGITPNILIRGEIYNGGASDGFAARLQADTGERLWAKYYGGIGYDTSTAVAAKEGNVFVTGATNTTLTVWDDYDAGFLHGLGARSTYLAPAGSTSTDAYLIHLTPLAGRRMGDTYLNANENGTDATGAGIAMDVYGNPFVIGTTRISELWRFDPTGVNGTYTPPTTVANTELFVASFTNSLVFAKSGVLIRAAADLLPGGVAVDSDGTVLIGGTTAATEIQTLKVSANDDADKAPASAVEFRRAAAGNSNGFVIKLDRGSEPVWGYFLGGDSADSVNAVTIDAEHNAVVAGTTTSDEWSSDSRFGNAYSANGDGYVSKLAIDSVPPEIGEVETRTVTPDNADSLAEYWFTVTYKASRWGEVDRQSVHGSEIAVMRSGMLMATARVTEVTAESDNDQVLVAKYVFRAPNGAWDPATDGGVYSLQLQGGQIRNADGYMLGTTDSTFTVGTFTVNLSRPTATISVDSVNSLSAADYTFTVTYDGMGSEITSYPTTLNIMGPSAASSMTAREMAASEDGNTVTVTYIASKPAAGWREGTRYTISIPAGAVLSDGNPNTQPASATFYVDSKVPTAVFGTIGSTAATFAVTYNGTGTGVSGYPTTLVMSTTVNGAQLQYNASVVSPTHVVTNGNSTKVTYTIPRSSLSATSRRYTITILAGTVEDLAGNTNSKAVIKSVSLKGTAAKVISLGSPALTSPFSNTLLANSAWTNSLLVVRPSLIA